MAEVFQRLATLKRTIIGDSPATKAMMRMILKVAPSAHTVLILGESGTGKELVAREIHQHSPRRDRPFLAVNCAALTETLLESELFGHEKGAFTDAHQMKRGVFERAHQSTLFLDEIGDTSLGMQAKILRVLQEREFFRVGGTEPLKTDVRIISATNRNLEQRVKEGKFREDLYYRLNVIPIVCPPLRERGDDIEASPTTSCARPRSRRRVRSRYQARGPGSAQGLRLARQHSSTRMGHGARRGAGRNR